MTIIFLPLTDLGRGGRWIYILCEEDNQKFNLANEQRHLNRKEGRRGKGRKGENVNEGSEAGRQEAVWLKNRKERKKNTSEVFFLKLKLLLFPTLFSVCEKHLKNKTDLLGETEKTTLVLIGLVNVLFYFCPLNVLHWGEHRVFKPLHIVDI